MPLLSYTASSFPFTAFTKILSADVVQCFNDVKTLLNTTKLDSTNVQAHGLTRKTSSSNIAAGLANGVVINDSNGDFSDEAQLATSRGGLGFDCSPSGVSDAQKVPSVNAAGTGFQLSVVPNPPAMNVFNYYQYS